MKTKSKKPLVGIIMGSDSDLEVMSAAAEVLDLFKIPFELTIVSAHRTPERLYTYSKSAHTRGIRVIIAGAGGAAHLPGMAAALSPLPVIGVPIQSTNSWAGIDSLLSIAQMPPGVPVATVAINGAKNAGILAAQILATSDKPLLARVKRYRTNMKKEVLSKIKSLKNTGFKKHLAKLLATQK